MADWYKDNSGYQCRLLLVQPQCHSLSNTFNGVYILGDGNVIHQHNRFNHLKLSTKAHSLILKTATSWYKIWSSHIGKKYHVVDNLHILLLVYILKKIRVFPTYCGISYYMEKAVV